MANYNSKYTGAKIDEGVEKGLNSATMTLVFSGSQDYIPLDYISGYDILVVHGYKEGIGLPNNTTFVLDNPADAVDQDYKWTTILCAANGASADSWVYRVQLYKNNGNVYFQTKPDYGSSTKFIVTAVYGLKKRG